MRCCIVWLLGTRGGLVWLLYILFFVGQILGLYCWLILYLSFSLGFKGVWEWYKKDHRSFFFFFWWIYIVFDGERTWYRVILNVGYRWMAIVGKKLYHDCGICLISKDWWSWVHLLRRVIQKGRYECPKLEAMVVASFDMGLACTYIVGLVFLSWQCAEVENIPILRDSIESIWFDKDQVTMQKFIRLNKCRRSCEGQRLNVL